MKFDPIEQTVTMASAYSVGDTNVFDVGAAGGDSISAIVTATVSTPSAKTFVSGTSQKTTVTFPTKAGSTGGDYFVVYDSAGLGWAAALNKSGSDPAPTGAVYASIAAGRKVNVDISGETTAADVATAVDTAFIALTSFPFTTVVTSAADAITCTIRGPTTVASVHNANDSGAGSITFATTTPGVASTVDVTANTITISSHGLTTALVGQLTSTGTLPAGLTTSTNYYVIVVDSDTIAFATTAAHALSGTKIDITDQGTNAATNTFTPTALSGCSVLFQGSNDNSTFKDSGSRDLILATGSIQLQLDRPQMRYYRIYLAITSGYVSLSSEILVKGDK